MSNVKNLLRKYRFELTDESHVSLGGFLSISPLTMGIRTSKYREGDDDNLLGVTIPGRRITEPLEVRRGCFIIADPSVVNASDPDGSAKFYKWIIDLQEGNIAEDALSTTFGNHWFLKIKNKSGVGYGRIYKIIKPILTMVRTGDLDALDSTEDVAWIESMVIEHSGIDPIATGTTA